MSEDTKVCPFCAETIKAAAVVCRFCGRDLPEVIEVQKAAPIESEFPVMQPDKSDEEIKKPKRRKLRNLIIALVVFPFLCLCGLFILVDSDPKTPEEIAKATSAAATKERSFTLTSVAPSPEPTDTLRPTPSPTPNMAPPFAEIAENYNEMTDAQWEVYARTLDGAYVENWEGVVDEVDFGEVFGGYNVFIDAGRDTFSSEVVLDNVTEELALNLGKDQKVFFSGFIKNATNTFGLSIYLDGETVIVEPFQGERSER